MDGLKYSSTIKLYSVWFVTFIFRPPLNLQLSPKPNVKQTFKVYLLIVTSHVPELTQLSLSTLLALTNLVLFFTLLSVFVDVELQLRAIVVKKLAL